jgi:hypothetical protein
LPASSPPDPTDAALQKGVALERRLYFLACRLPGPAKKRAGVPEGSRLCKFETSGKTAKHLRGERLKRTQRREEIAEPASNNREFNIGDDLPFCNATYLGAAMRLLHEPRACAANLSLNG